MHQDQFYLFELYSYTDVGKNQQKYTLSLPGKFIRSLNFIPSGGNTLICTGMYASAGKISVEGVFTFTYDLVSKEVKGLNTKELGSELISLGFDQNELRPSNGALTINRSGIPFHISCQT